MTATDRLWHVVPVGGSHTVWTGSKAECDAYVAGAHANAVNAYLLVVAVDGCSCGAERREVRFEGDSMFHLRTGCATCDRWDEPLRRKEDR